MNGSDAKALGCSDVGERIINKNAFSRIQMVAAQE
jgi:hypothetical protein